VLCGCAGRVLGWTGEPLPVVGRRQWLSAAVGVAVVSRAAPVASAAFGELPPGLKDYTKLAPLGPSTTTTTATTTPFSKTYGLSLEDLARRLTRDLTQGATGGQGSYILSGDLSDDIFRDDCVFTDPTNRVRSLAQYKKALQILFDPELSVVQLVGPLRVNATERTIAGVFRSRGVLKLPWKPFISAYEAEIVYKIDTDGLVYAQEQHWSKSSAEALRETFSPSFFYPPPKSTLVAAADEPMAVTSLFDICNGRRPDEYSAAEETEIAAWMHLIEETHTPWEAPKLPGTWKLVYLQAGPTGAGVDRRIPFPEFSFNDQYQIFTPTTVTNRGELFGPGFFAQVTGGVTEVDSFSRRTPKALEANIQGGQVCVGQACFPLPIQGVGLFDILYLGDRLRILQNRNGGGAKGVQIKMGA
jgi:hypothetical protein